MSFTAFLNYVDACWRALITGDVNNSRFWVAVAVLASIFLIIVILLRCIFVYRAKYRQGLEDAEDHMAEGNKLWNDNTPADALVSVHPGDPHMMHKHKLASMYGENGQYGDGSIAEGSLMERQGSMGQHGSQMGQMGPGGQGSMMSGMNDSFMFYSGGAGPNGPPPMHAHPHLHAQYGYPGQPPPGPMKDPMTGRHGSLSDAGGLPYPATPAMIGQRAGSDAGSVAGSVASSVPGSLDARARSWGRAGVGPGGGGAGSEHGSIATEYGHMQGAVPPPIFENGPPPGQYMMPGNPHRSAPPYMGGYGHMMPQPGGGMMSPSFAGGPPPPGHYMQGPGMQAGMQGPGPPGSMPGGSQYLPPPPPPQHLAVQSPSGSAASSAYQASVAAVPLNAHQRAPSSGGGSDAGDDDGASAGGSKRGGGSRGGDSSGKGRKERAPNPPAYLNMVNPVLDGGAVSSVSVSHGVHLEGEIIIPEDTGDLEEEGMPGAPIRHDVAVPGLLHAGQLREAGGRAKSLTEHLGVNKLITVQPKLADSAMPNADAVVGQLLDLGLRVWVLKRRVPDQYAIIRRMHNLADPYTKESIDVGGEVRTHDMLDKPTTVEGDEDVIYIDIAMDRGLWLDVLVPELEDADRQRWVRLQLVEGSVASLPKALIYRLRLPEHGCVGLVRCRTKRQ